LAKRSRLEYKRRPLFDDMREVELVCNGKTSDVCNVVLPFQTIEHVDESQTCQLVRGM
jgi:hypothetical protein